MKKGTLLMVLLAMALGAAVWYLEFKRAKPAEDEAGSSKQLFTFKQEEITALTITRGSGTIHFEKRGEAWRMKQPVGSATDAGAVEGLLSSLTFARISRTIAITPAGSAEALKPFELDAPRISLEIKLKSGATHRLRLGAKDFTGGDVYALVDNSTGVALVSGDVLSNADKPVLEFRDRRIAVFEEAELTSIRLKNEHGTLAAAKNTEGKWIVSEPAALRGKEVEIERIVNAVREARAEGILDAPTAAERGRLARPAVEVELTTKDGSVRKVEFSGGKGDVYVRSSLGPMLFKVVRATFDALNFKLAEVVKKEEAQPEEAAKDGPAKKQE